MKLSQEKFKHQNQLFLNRVAQKPFLIAAHRGEWGANIVQNSIDSARLAYQFGAEVFELDVCQSKDGYYFGFHSKKEKEVFGEDIAIEAYTFAEIKAMPVLNGIGEKIKASVQLIDEIIDNVPSDMFIQLDRSWFYWDTFLDHLNQYSDSVKERLILKSPIKTEWLDKLESADFKVMYMPIIHHKAQVDILSSYHHINYIGLEVIAEDLTSELYGEAFIKEVHQDYQLFVQLNAIRLNDHSQLYAGYDDNISLLDSPDKGWGMLHQIGADLIQTDWTMPLDNYRQGLMNVPTNQQSAYAEIN